MEIKKIRKMVSIIIVEDANGNEEKIALGVEWDLPHELTYNNILDGFQPAHEATLDFLRDLLLKE